MSGLTKNPAAGPLTGKVVEPMHPIKSVAEPLRHAAESAPAKRAASLADEFKRFAFKGNVVDLAVGVIIGAAFGKVVDALVKSVILPFVGAFGPGDPSYRGWKLPLWDGKDIPYGEFLAEVVNFLIVAFVLFLFVRKFLGWMVRSKEDAPPPPTLDQELLTEIRDLLKKSATPPAA